MTLSYLFRTLVAVAVSCGGLVVSRAQSRNDQQVTEVVFMSWEQAPTGLFVTKDGKTFTQIEAPAYVFGRPATIRMGDPVRVYQRVMRDGKPAYEVVGESALPPGCKVAEAYLARQPDKDGLLNYRVVAMSNDIDAFKVGEVRIFNFSPHAGLLKVGNTSGEIGPLEWKMMKGVPDRKHRVTVASALQVNGAWTTAVRNMLTLRPDYRGNVLIMHTQAALRELDPDLTGVSKQQPPRIIVLATSEYIPPAVEKPTRGVQQLSALSR